MGPSRSDPGSREALSDAPTARGHSVVLVTVPALEDLVRPPLQKWAPDYLHADPDAVHAHLTLLGPFLGRDDLTPRVLADLRDLFAATRPFSFRLATLGRFAGDGLVHLVPDPVEPFRALTAELWHRYPQCPPYGGAFGEVVPHLSIDHAPTVEHLAPLVEPYLPVVARATEAQLYWYEPRASCSLATFPFRRQGD